jgi:hypothetical protein
VLLLLLCLVQRAHHCLGTHCSILYQRGIYPTDSFRQEQHYGLSIMVSKDQGLTAYLQTVTQQMSSEHVLATLDIRQLRPSACHYRTHKVTLPFTVLRLACSDVQLGQCVLQGTMPCTTAAATLLAVAACLSCACRLAGGWITAAASAGSKQCYWQQRGAGALDLCGRNRQGSTRGRVSSSGLDCSSRWYAGNPI